MFMFYIEENLRNFNLDRESVGGDGGGGGGGGGECEEIKVPV